MSKKNAVIILSGGMDSVTSLAYAVNKGFGCFSLTFDYGQKSKSEIRAAHYYSKFYNCKKHKIFQIDFSSFSSSALTEADKSVIDDSSNKIPSTYVSMRNIIFLSIACSWAETLSCEDVFIGANAIDYSGYPDCRKEFIISFERLINKCTKKGLEGRSFRIKTPLINLSKREIVLVGKKNNVDFSKTSSCYNPKNLKSCGLCDSCLLRKKGFKDAKVKDPLVYDV